MSKAEETAYKAYPYNGDYRGQGDSNSKFREAYIKGYHQAEKDLKLTIEKACQWFKSLDDSEIVYNTTEDFINAFRKVMEE